MTSNRLRQFSRSPAKLACNVQLAGIILIALAACASRHNILSHMAEQDEADNLGIAAQMKSRPYEIGIKTLANSVSEVLSNINKSANLLKEEIGAIETVETGAPAQKSAQETSELNEQEGKSFRNTFKYIGENYTPWVTARLREINESRTEVDLTFTRTDTDRSETSSLPIPPEHTRSIYHKLWSAIERDL